MKEVNGLPSTVTSTRRRSSCGTTSTRGLGAWGSGFGIPESQAPSPKPQAISHTVRMSASTHHDVLLAIIEHHLAAGVHRGDGHAQSYGVAVAGVDVRVGLPTRADALHPVPHVGNGGRVAAGVRRGLRR